MRLEELINREREERLSILLPVLNKNLINEDQLLNTILLYWYLFILTATLSVSNTSVKFEQ